MAKLRGRPLLYFGVVLAGWIAGRSMMLDAPANPITASPAFAAKPSLRAVSAKPDMEPAIAASRSISRARAAQRRAPRPFFTSFGLHPAQDPWQEGGRPSGLPMLTLVAGGGEPLSTGRDTPPTNALAPVGKAGSPPLERRWGANVYAYSFWRFSTGESNALAPQAQYGGSQSGMILTVDPFGAQDKGLAILARGAFTPDGADKELALGLRWRPAANVPLSLSAERRFRFNGVDRFSFYAAGGLDKVPVIGELALDAYAQAGFATGKGGSGFFDAQGKLTHPVGELGGVRVKAGAGSWAGGQRGASRLDVGPTIAAQIDAGPAPILIQLDWRLRAAGDARPKNGLALTVSSGF
jgi:hypothetical protein